MAPLITHYHYTNVILLLALSQTGSNCILAGRDDDKATCSHLGRYYRVVGRAFWTSQHHAMLKLWFLISSMYIVYYGKSTQTI